MGYSNGRITAPVSITDIKNALGVSSNVVSVLCTHGNINKWSKAKPHKVDNNFNSSRDCGYGIPYYTSIGAMFNAGVAITVGSETGWSYEKPTDNYKMGHFIDYNVNATVPLKGFVNPESASASSTIQVGYNGPDSPTGVGTVDLTDLTSQGVTLRYGVAFRKSNASGNPYACTLDNFTSDGLKGQLNSGGTGTYDVVFFISSVSFSWGSYPAGVFGLTARPHISFSYSTSSPAALSYTAQFNSSMNAITLQIGLASGSATYSRMNFVCSDGINDYTTVLESSSFTMNTTKRSYTIYAPSGHPAYSLFDTFKVYLYSGSSYREESISVMGGGSGPRN